jgi:hypoxanthine phosphoribosyltransferase
MKEIVSEKHLKSIVKNLASQINLDYLHADGFIIIGLLKGSFIFLADLIRQIELPVKVDFISVSSYKDNTQGSEIKVNMNLSVSIADKDVLVVEDIVDSGKTLSTVLNLLAQKNPKSLRTCVLLNKKRPRVIDTHIDYCGMEIPDVYPFGYGLDDDEFLRGLPFIAYNK